MEAFWVRITQSKIMKEHFEYFKSQNVILHAN